MTGNDWEECLPEAHLVGQDGELLLRPLRRQELDSVALIVEKGRGGCQGGQLAVAIVQLDVKAAIDPERRPLSNIFTT